MVSLWIRLVYPVDPQMDWNQGIRRPTQHHWPVFTLWAVSSRWKREQCLNKPSSLQWCLVGAQTSALWVVTAVLSHVYHLPFYSQISCVLCPQVWGQLKENSSKGLYFKLFVDPFTLKHSHIKGSWRLQIQVVQKKCRERKGRRRER